MKQSDEQKGQEKEYDEAAERQREGPREGEG
jgi:hypothetical protein